MHTPRCRQDAVVALPLLLDPLVPLAVSLKKGRTLTVQLRKEPLRQEEVSVARSGGGV